jgi:hypothetical protein
MRLGVVSGRRRHGKSYLLRALCESVGGLHITAIREEGQFEQQYWAQQVWQQAA